MHERTLSQGGATVDSAFPRSPEIIDSPSASSVYSAVCVSIKLEHGDHIDTLHRTSASLLRTPLTARCPLALLSPLSALRPPSAHAPSHSHKAVTTIPPYSSLFRGESLSTQRMHRWSVRGECGPASRHEQPVARQQQFLQLRC